MKNVFFLLAALATIIFGFSLYHLYKNTGLQMQYHGGDLAGFDTSISDPISKSLREHFASLLKSLRLEEENSKKYGLYINFIVTLLSGITTLIASVKTAQTAGDMLPKKIVIITAILSFCTTLASWGESKISDFRNETQQKIQKVRDLRTNFSNDYRNETDEVRKQQMINTYEDQLSDI